MEENEKGTVIPDANLEQQYTIEDYLNVINDLKSKSVSKEDYDKLKEENRQLLNSIVNNTYPDKDEPEEENNFRTSDEVREELYCSGKQYTNYEIATLLCELRDSLDREGKGDDIIPHKTSEVVSDEALASARRCLDVFDQCIEEANGNPALFNAYFQNRIVDVKKGGR